MKPNVPAAASRIVSGRTDQGWLSPALSGLSSTPSLLLCVPEAPLLMASPRPSGFGLAHGGPIRRAERPRGERSGCFLPVPSVLRSRVPAMAVSPRHLLWHYSPWLTGLLPLPLCPGVAQVLGTQTVFADFLHPACTSVISPSSKFSSLEPPDTICLSCWDPV